MLPVAAKGKPSISADVVVDRLNHPDMLWFLGRLIYEPKYHAALRDLKRVTVLKNA